MYTLDIGSLIMFNTYAGVPYTCPIFSYQRSQRRDFKSRKPVSGEKTGCPI